MSIDRRSALAALAAIPFTRSLPRSLLVRPNGAAEQTGATFSPGEVRELFRTNALVGPNFPGYDVTKDGRSFIILRPPPTSEQGLTMLLNWFDNQPGRPR